MVGRATLQYWHALVTRNPKRGSMVGWTIVVKGIMLIHVMVVFMWKQRSAGHIAGEL
jgi:hypothetical protein